MVVTWFAIQLLIVFGILSNWSLHQVDFDIVYPQAPIEMDRYMELLADIHTKGGNSNDHVLKLLANIYKQKQSGCIWNNYLVTKLQEINFKQSLVDDCVFYSDDVIFIVYVDNGIFLESSKEQLTGIITGLQNLDLSIEDQGHPADYIGVNIKRLKNNLIELSQCTLIDSFIDDVALNDWRSIVRIMASHKRKGRGTVLWQRLPTHFFRGAACVTLLALMLAIHCGWHYLRCWLC